MPEYLIKMTVGLDGVPQVTGGLQQIDSAADRMGTRTQTATGRMAAGMGDIENAAGRMAGGMDAATGRMAGSLGVLQGSLAALGAGFTMAGVINQVQSAINVIDSLKISTIQIAAQITTMQGPKNVAEHYKAATLYADDLAKKLQEVDANSFANYQTLLQMTQTMTLQGVVLDTNNKKQVASFTSLSNAIAMMTAGQNQSIQAHQEIRALMSGEVNQGSQLAKQIDEMAKNSGIYKGGLKEIVAEGKKHGDTLERLAPFLVGVNAASGDISRTWQAIVSSAETAFGILQRAFFKDFFNDATQAGGSFVSWLKSSEDNVTAWGKNFMRILYSLGAEIIRMGMLLDKIGGTATSAQMLLYGPGKALGVKSSTERFDRAAQNNIDFETRYNEKSRMLEDLALKMNKLDETATRAGNAVVPKVPGGQQNDAAIKAAADAAKAADAEYKTYSTTMDSFNKRIYDSNPLIDEHAKKLHDIDLEVQKAIEATPQYAESLTAAGETLKINARLSWEMQAALKQNKTELEEYAEAAEAVAAMEKRNADEAKKYQSDLAKITQENIKAKTDLIRDPMARQRQQLIDNYNYEKSILEAARKNYAEDSEMRFAIDEQLALKEQQLIRDTTSTAFTGMIDAMYEYQASVGTIGENIKNTFVSAFQAMEDALVNFTMTGKINFKQMADSIIADLVRIIIKQEISRGLSMVTNYISGASSTTGTSGSSLLSNAVNIGVAAGVKYGYSALSSLGLGSTSIGASLGASSAYGLTTTGTSLAANAGAITAAKTGGYSLLSGAGSISGGSGAAAGGMTATGYGAILAGIAFSIKSMVDTYGERFENMSKFAQHVYWANPSLQGIDGMFGGAVYGGQTKSVGSGLMLNVNGSSDVQATDTTSMWRKGGWVQKGARWTEYANNAAAGSDLSAVMASLVSDLSSSVESIGEKLDLSKFNSSAFILTSGRSVADINKDISTFMNKTLNEMAFTIDGMKDLGGTAENSVQVLMDVISALESVNSYFELIGRTAIESSMAGAKAVTDLIGLFGGMEQFDTSMNTYFKLMYSEAEKAAMELASAQKSVNEQFQQLGLTVPKTNAEFNTLRDGLDLMTSSGRETFTALTNLAPAFSLVTQAAQEAAEKATALARTNQELSVTLLDLQGKTVESTNLQRQLETEGMDPSTLAIQHQIYALQDLQRVSDAQAALDQARADAERQMLQDTADAFTKTAETLKAELLQILDFKISATQALLDIMGGNQSILSPEEMYRQKQAEFASTKAQALAGSRTALTALPGLAKALLDASRGYNASGAGYQSDYTNVTQTLASISGLPDTAQLTLDVAQQQLQALQKIQADTNKGTIDQNVLLGKVTGGLAGMQTMLQTYLSASIGANNAQAAVLAASSAATSTAAQSVAAAAAALAEAQKTQAALAAAIAAAAAKNVVVPPTVIPPPTPVDPNLDAKNALQAQISELQAQLASMDAAKSTAATNLAAATQAAQYAYVMGWGTLAAQNAALAANYQQQYNNYVSQIAAAQRTLNGLQARLASLPAFDVGTSYVQSDMPAYVHRGEIIMDRASADVLRRYGIPQTGSADNRETVAELKETNRQLAASVRVLQAGFTRLIEVNERQEKRLAGVESKTKLQAAA